MTVRVRLEGEAGLHLTVYVACRWSWPVGAGQALVLQRGASPNHADLHMRFPPLRPRLSAPMAPLPHGAVQLEDKQVKMMEKVFNSVSVDAPACSSPPDTAAQSPPPDSKTEPLPSSPPASRVNIGRHGQLGLHHQG